MKKLQAAFVATLVLLGMALPVLPVMAAPRISSHAPSAGVMDEIPTPTPTPILPHIDGPIDCSGGSGC